MEPIAGRCVHFENEADMCPNKVHKLRKLKTRQVLPGVLLWTATGTSESAIVFSRFSFTYSSYDWPSKFGKILPLIKGSSNRIFHPNGKHP